VYRYTPTEIDHVRAEHQADWNNSSQVDAKRIGNLGELAFERFLREFVPTEMWDWNNADALRRCNEESYSAHDFEVFGYAIDVKTSRDVSAFMPEALLENDDADDIIVMTWHRDNEDALMLLGWERIETLRSKAETEFDGESPDSLDHLAARPMNQLLELGPTAAQMNQKAPSTFAIGDEVVPENSDAGAAAVIVDLLPRDLTEFGSVEIAFKSDLDDGPGDWREFHPAKLASYADDQNVRTWKYGPERLHPA
jgi:hypothetical protein